MTSVVRRSHRLLLYVLAALLPLANLPFAPPPPALAVACLQNGVVVDPCPTPPDLLNPNQLFQSRVAPPTIYAATAAQITSLNKLQAQAIANTIADHSLASTDGDAVKSWGRNDALAELWALLVQAVQTPQATRTADQQNAVDWLTKLSQREAAVAANNAGLEYVKWAGLDQTAYTNLLTTNPSATDLQTFLSGGTTNSPPLPYNFINSSGQVINATGSGGVILVNLAAASTGGFCVYQSPSPYGSDYTSNIFNTGASANTPQDCFTPCTNLLGCDPPTPSYDDFTKWGAATANNALFNTTGMAHVSRSAAIGASMLGATAAIPLAGFGISSGLAGVMAGTAFQQAVFPFAARVAENTVSQAVAAAEAAGEDATEAAAEVAAEATEIGGEVAATGVGSVVAIVVLAIVAAVLEGIKVFDAAALPGKLATLITSAPTNAVDLNATLADSTKAGALYALFIGATLPEPKHTTCDDVTIVGGANGIPAPCLNTTPVPAASSSDLQFAIQAKGATTSTTANTLTWRDASSGTTTVARLSETWFVDTVSATGLPSTTVQTLRMRYTDWSDAEQIAWLIKLSTGAYTFVGAPESALGGAALIPSTCQTSKTCFSSPSINVVGSDGNDYTASVISQTPTVNPQVVTTNPLEGSPVTFKANGSSPSGSALTYQWLFQPITANVCLNTPYVPPFTCATPVSGAQVSNTWTTSGTFEVQLIATDALSRSTTDTFAVAIGDVPPTLALSPVAIQGKAVTLTGSITHAGSDDTETLSVDWGDGTPVDTRSIGGPVFLICTGTCVVNLTPTSSTMIGLSATHTYAVAGNYTVVARVTDQASGTTTRNAPVKMDITAPTTTISATPPSPNGQNGWYTSALNVGISATDPDDTSGIHTGCVLDPSSPPASFSALPTAACAYLSPGASLSGDGTHTIYAASVDPVGNTEARVQSATFKIDTTLPTLSAAAKSEANSNGWYNSDVIIHFTCSDAPAGIASCPADQTLSSEGSSVSSTAQKATDLAGNTSLASNVVTVKLDKTAPAVSVTGVSDAATYTVGIVPAAGCTTSDALSGVATTASLHVTGGTPNGVGTFTAACSGALDSAGNSGSASATYTVVYAFSGFLAPVNGPPTVNTGKAGKTYPVKWQLSNASGNFISTLSAVVSITYKSTNCQGFSTDPTDVLETSTTGGTSLRYDSQANQYVYNWATPAVTGCYTLFVNLDTGKAVTAFFNLS